MLGAELAAYQSRVDSGEVAEPAASAELGLSTLHLGQQSPCSPKAMYSQSLPSGGSHMMMRNSLPAKPRPKPTPAPSSLMNLPILELPEQSPQCGSLLGRSGGLTAAMEAEATDGVYAAARPMHRLVRHHT